MLLFFFARYSHFVRHCKCSLTDLIRAELICHSLCSPTLSFSFSFTHTLSLSLSLVAAHCRIVKLLLCFLLCSFFISFLLRFLLNCLCVFTLSLAVLHYALTSPPHASPSCSSHALCPLRSFVSAFIAGVGLFALLSITLDLSHLTVILRRLL